MLGFCNEDIYSHDGASEVEIKYFPLLFGCVACLGLERDEYKGIRIPSNDKHLLIS